MINSILICTQCAYKGRPKIITKGSVIIELVLWLCFFVPGFCYSMWRRTNRPRVCPACGSPYMIPLDSPKAQELLKLKPFKRKQIEHKRFTIPPGDTIIKNLRPILSFIGTASIIILILLIICFIFSEPVP